MQKKAEWDIFRALCNFFNLSVEEIYYVLQQNSDVLEYYPHLDSFKVALVQRPVAIMNKEGIRDGIINISSVMKEDCFACMNNDLKYAELSKKWTT